MKAKSYQRTLRNGILHLQIPLQKHRVLIIENAHGIICFPKKYSLVFFDSQKPRSYVLESYVNSTHKQF